MRLFLVGFTVVGLMGCGSQGVPSQNGMPGVQVQTAASTLAKPPSIAVVGIVNPDGTAAKGTGFLSRRLAKGRYRIFAQHFGGCAAIFVTPTENTAAYTSARQIGCTPRFNVVFAVFGGRSESSFQFQIVRIPE